MNLHSAAFIQQRTMKREMYSTPALWARRRIRSQFSGEQYMPRGFESLAMSSASSQGGLGVDPGIGLGDQILPEIFGMLGFETLPFQEFEHKHCPNHHAK